MHKIKEFRLFANLRQVDLAKLLNVSDICISYWENNLRAPKLKICYEIINMAKNDYGFEIRLEDLLPESIIRESKL